MLVIKQLINDLILSNRHQEQSTDIRFYSFNINKRSFSTLQTLSKKLIEHKLGNLIATTSLGYQLEFEKEFEEGRDADNAGSVVIRKNNQFSFFFSESGLRNYLTNKNIETKDSFVKLGFTDKKFSSKNIHFISLYEELETPASSEYITISPLNYVKPLNLESQQSLVANIANIVIGEGNMIAPKIWKITACKKLLCTIGSEFNFSNDNLKVSFKGNARKKISFEINDKQTFERLFSPIDLIAEWIYFSNKDIETRHTIFNHQFSALVHNEFDAISIDEKEKIFSESLENSKLAYNFHLENEGKELSITLIQLNKTLFDYNTQIRNNTTSLTNSLWKDFTTLLGFLFLKFAFKEPDIPSNYFQYLSYALIVYLILSLIFSWRNGYGFYINIKKNLADWRYRIYGYLSQKDFDMLVTRQLEKAQNSYYCSFGIVLILYVAMIIALLTLSNK